MSKKRFPNKDFRLQVNLQQGEELEIKSAAKRAHESVPAYVRRVLLKELGRNLDTEEKKSQLKIIGSSIENLSSRISKIESVLRMLVVNTAIARGHASGVLELASQAEHDVLHKRMFEARDEQKKMFFELFPEMREVQQ